MTLYQRTISNIELLFLEMKPFSKKLIFKKLSVRATILKGRPNTELLKLK